MLCGEEARRIQRYALQISSQVSYAGISGLHVSACVDIYIDEHGEHRESNPGVTKVNFYRVQGDLEAVLALSCRLVEQAWQQDIDALIYTTEEQTAALMSDRLWDWSASSFLPHRRETT